jgi:hypothetical protein
MRTESGTCVLILLLFATPFFAQTAVLHSVTEDSLTVRDAERVCLSEILITAPGPDSSAQSVEAKHKVEQVRQAVRSGGAFADRAAANSPGPSAVPAPATNTRCSCGFGKFVQQVHCGGCPSPELDRLDHIDFSMS